MYNKKARFITVALLIIITLIGFYTKFYEGQNQNWVNNSLGGFFYEIFWCLLVLLIIPRANAGNIALSVFFFICIIEVIQLWHPPFLQIIRSTFIGATIFGTSFAAWDFLYYILGSIVGWLLIKLIQRISGRKTTKRNTRHKVNI